MAGLRFDYDTAAIRRDARKIRKCADTILDSAIPSAKRAQRNVDSELAGEAASAMERSLIHLRRDLERQCDALELISRALMVYADQLDEADRRVQEIMDN